MIVRPHYTKSTATQLWWVFFHWYLY